MQNAIRGYERDLNDAKLAMRRIWGAYSVRYFNVEGVKFFTLTYTGCTVRDHVRVVFCNQPTYGQYLMVMSVLAKPSSTAFVLCENISKLTLWSDK